MTKFDYTLIETESPCIGLIVLQTDETIETELTQVIPPDVSRHVTRIPSAPLVSLETLARMEKDLPTAASLLPARVFDAVGYGCTSGTARIGQARVAELVRQGVGTRHVTDPITALIAACTELGIDRLALLSPYLPEVSDRMREVLSVAGIDTPVFGSFEESDEARAARIDPDSISEAALQLAQKDQIDGLFISCTNLRTFSVLPQLQAQLSLPVLSSNLVLGWHLMRLAGLTDQSPSTFLR